MDQALAVDSDEVCERIVSGVAALEGADPMELPPLFEVVDPDALEAVFSTTVSGTRRSGTVAFTYAGHQVTVEFDEAHEPVVTID